MIYLANIAQMLDGRKRRSHGKRAFDSNYCVPVLKFVIDGDPEGTGSQRYANPKHTVARVGTVAILTGLPPGRFDLTKPTWGENSWTINGRVFDPARNEANRKEASLNSGPLSTRAVADPSDPYPSESTDHLRDGRPAQETMCLGKMLSHWKAVRR